MPMTSPVERISGPSTVSTPGNRPNGSTAAFTADVRQRPVRLGPAGGTMPSRAEVAERARRP